MAQSIYFQRQIVEAVRVDDPGNLQIPQQPAERAPRRVINSDARAKEQRAFRSSRRRHSASPSGSISSAALSRSGSVITSTKALAKISFSDRGAAKVTKPAPLRIPARQAKTAAPVFPREPAITST